MKHSGTTIIFVIVCVGVLFAAYVIGLGIRQVRFRQARAQSKATAQSQMSVETPKPGVANEPEREGAETAQVPSERGPMPGQEGRRFFRDMSEEERAKLRERWQNMSDEERKKERERRRAEMQQMREKMENMSEEEREKFMAEMRERFGDRQNFGRSRVADSNNLSKSD